jgi:pilus assembly protein CpaB
MARTVTAAGGRTNRKFLIVAVLFGALTAVLFYAMTSNRGGSTSSAPAVGDQQVVVAKVAIKQRTALTADMLELKSVPLNTVITGSYATVADAVDKVTKFPIEANQQVVASGVVDTAHPLGDAALSEVVPTGRRAMSIQSNQVLSAGGLILPGDFVDIIWVCCSKPDKAIATLTMLRNVQVVAVAQSIVASGPVTAGSSADSSGGAVSAGQAPVASGTGKPLPEAVTITLLLTPQEAQRVFMAELTGTLRADLRSVGDQDTPETPPSIATDLLPLDLINKLPDALKPEGYPLTGR